MPTRIFGLAILVTTLLWGSNLPAFARGTCDDRELCCDFLEGDCEAPVYDKSRVALVVGTDVYQDFLQSLSIGDLENAGNDALYIGDQLKSVGFQVRYLLNPTPKEFKAEYKLFQRFLEDRADTFDMLRNEEVEEHLAFVYVAGHGFSLVQPDATTSENIIFRATEEQLLLNLSVETRYDRTGISNFWLRSKLKDAGQYPVIFVIDTCRSFPVVSESVIAKDATAVRFRNSPGTYSRPRESNLRERFHSVLYSTSAGQVASDNSPFDGRGAFASQIGPLLSTPGLTLFDIKELSQLLLPTLGQGIKQRPSDIFNGAYHVEIPFSHSADVCANSEGIVWKAVKRCTRLDERCHQTRICRAVLDEINRRDTQHCGYQTLFDMAVDGFYADGQYATISDLCEFSSLIAAVNEPDLGFAFRDSQVIDIRSTGSGRNLEAYVNALPANPTVAANLALQPCSAGEACAPPVGTAFQLPSVGGTDLNTRLALESTFGDTSNEDEALFLGLGLAQEDIAEIRAAASPSPGTIGNADTDALRRYLLKGLDETGTSRAGVPVIPLDDFQLFMAPFDDSPVIVRNPNDLPGRTVFRRDCVNNACNENWIGVTYFDGLRFTRGFARTETLAVVAPKDLIELSIVPNQNLSRFAINQLRDIAQKAVELSGHIQLIYDIAPTPGEILIPLDDLKVQDRLQIANLIDILLQEPESSSALAPANLDVQYSVRGNGARSAILSLRVPISIEDAPNLFNER